MSKQRDYQKARQARGVCIFCPEPISKHSICLCEKHQEAARQRYRLAHGSLGWEPGKRGRPPNSVRGVS